MAGFSLAACTTIPVDQRTEKRNQVDQSATVVGGGSGLGVVFDNSDSSRTYLNIQRLSQLDVSGTFFFEAGKDLSVDYKVRQRIGQPEILTSPSGEA